MRSIPEDPGQDAADTHYPSSSDPATFALPVNGHPLPDAYILPMSYSTVWRRELPHQSLQRERYNKFHVADLNVWPYWAQWRLPHFAFIYIWFTTEFYWSCKQWGKENPSIVRDRMVALQAIMTPCCPGFKGIDTTVISKVSVKLVASVDSHSPLHWGCCELRTWSSAMAVIERKQDHSI